MPSPTASRPTCAKGSTVPAHRSVLLRVEVRKAGKLCRCKHNRKHTIIKGQPRLVVKEPGPGTPEYGYCASCAAEMLDLADAKIAVLRADLAGDSD